MEAVRSLEYDIIITDLDMPLMNGVEMTRELRNEGYRGAIIGLSGHALEEDKKMMIEAGMNDVLSKPATRDDVEAAIRRVSGSFGRG